MIEDKVLFVIGENELLDCKEEFFYKKIFEKEIGFYGRIMYKGKEYKLIRIQKSKIDFAISQLSSFFIPYFIFGNYNELLNQSITVTIDFKTLRKLEKYMETKNIEVYSNGIKRLLEGEKI